MPEEIIIRKIESNLPDRPRKFEPELVEPSVISSEDVRKQAKKNMLKLDKLLNPYG